MKNVLLICFILLSSSASSQVIADPATNEIAITSPINPIINFNALSNATVQLKIPIYNLNSSNALPGGSCKIKIGLGSKIVLDPSFDVSTMLPNSYFAWSAVNSGGQIQITGNLIASLPNNFLDTAVLLIKGSLLGSSTITTNFLVTNHNTSTTLSDENPSNNNASLPYTVSSILPVNFTGINISKSGCRVDIRFSTAREFNVNRFELEVSKNGMDFIKFDQTAARNAGNYSFTFTPNDSFEVHKLFVRIKSVDNDGRFQYSPIKMISGICSAAAGIMAYPNPMQSTKTITISRQTGYFDGNYTIAIISAAGQLIQEEKISLKMVNQFVYTLHHLSAGKYFLQLINSTTGEASALQIEKL